MDYIPPCIRLNVQTIVPFGCKPAVGGTNPHLIERETLTFPFSWVRKYPYHISSPVIT